MSHYILAIDQGTSSTRSIIFDKNYAICGMAQQEIAQIYPKPAWVEHNPEEILQSCIETARLAIKNAGLSSKDITALGISNQRETTVLWDKNTGKPIYNAIVWQDRRTSDYCQNLKNDGHEKHVSESTGLLLDPYFSATKINWLLENIEDARTKAAAGSLLFGTIDSWLLWNFTKGKAHATDATNASRTLLFNIKTQQWDQELLDIFNIPSSILPEVHDCAADFGKVDASLFGSEIPIYGIAGDQHAATIGQACFKPGMVKSTYGTGCFIMLNTGDNFVPSSHRLLTTLAYRLNGKTSYALEGSIFMAGAAVQWLRDGLGIIEKASHCDAMAEASDSEQEVYLVPAFTGLGAPYWDANAQGLICGLTQSSGANEIARATLESVCYQTADLLKAMQDDWQKTTPTNAINKTLLRVDGGMTASNWTMQYLANIINATIDRPKVLETTALGAAWLAGSYAGVWKDQKEFSQDWKMDQQFTPDMDKKTRQKKKQGWQDAVKRTVSS